MPQKPPDTDRNRDFSVIDHAPLEAGTETVSPEDVKFYIDFAAQLQEENFELRAEIDRLKGEMDVDKQKAQLMRPYANRVFNFLVAYCAFVGMIILMQGFDGIGYSIPEMVLGILAGSTAVAAIGLVGFVVKGLFGSQ
jgi:hypothetical protein